jgi:hypothetical protein
VDNRAAASGSRARLSAGKEVREVEETWDSRDVPVLDAVVRYFDEHPQGVMLSCQEVAGLAGRDPTDVYRALKGLEPTYVRLVEGLGHGPMGSSVRGVTDAARRAVGQWPSPEVWADRIVGALLEAADRELDEARQSRLRAAADALAGFGRDVLVGVLSGGITRGMGLS